MIVSRSVEQFEKSVARKMTTTVDIVKSEWKFVGDGPQSRVSKSPLQLFLEAIVQSRKHSGNINKMTGNRFER